MEFQKDKTDHPLYIKSISLLEPPNKSEIIITNNAPHSEPQTVSFSSSFIILFNKIIPDWPPRTLDELTMQHVSFVINHKPEIILLGIGSKLATLDYKILEPLYTNKIPFEVMTTLNACRTYNLLASEHRMVAAALII